MFDEEEIKKTIKLISQEAWKRDSHTTINDMVEFIVRESLLAIVLPKFLELQESINDLEDNQLFLLESKSLDDEVNKLDNEEESLDVSKDGGFQKPQGSDEARVKPGRPKTR